MIKGRNDVTARNEFGRIRKLSKITPKSELYNEHCSDYTNGFDIGFPAMHCNDQAHFHRISVQDINPGSLNSVNIIANNMGGANEARVPWREKRGDSGRAWMFLNLQDDNTEVGFRIFHMTTWFYILIRGWIGSSGTPRLDGRAV